MPEEKSKDGPKPTVITSKDGLRPFLTQILDDCLFNIIHDVVATTHSAEKKLRMQSAAIQVESIALATTGNPPSTPIQANAPTSAKPALPAPSAPPQGQFNTTAALWDNGRVTLKGNPFKLQKENYCPNCKLPRLMFPLTGVGAKIPEDTNRSYCTLHPFIQKPGHDIYGNPFPVDPGKTKKEREALRKLERQEKDNTPGSTETGNADGESGGTGDPSIRKLMAGGKGATYVPWHTCPNCKRSLLITKFAQHLEKCMGIGGRTSRNAAVARLSSINGNGNGSQQGSRTGTPAPSQGSNSKRDADLDSDKEDGPPKKKLKKDKKDRFPQQSSQSSLQRDTKEPKVVLKFKTGSGSSTSNSTTTSKAADPTKRPPKSSSQQQQDKNSDHESGSSSKIKRDREGSAADDLPKKKMRVGKESSTTLPEITAGSD